MESGNNMFLVVSVVILAITLMLGGGVFIYNRILAGQVAAKEAALQAAEQSVSESTVDSFIRLRDRLTQSNKILGDHILLSQFFDALETLTLASVRFTSLTITVNQDHTATLKLAGLAKNFNALAAQSASFATQPLIKRAIFSNINADTNGVVAFTVSATLDPRMVTISTAVPASWAGGAGTGDTATTTP